MNMDTAELDQIVVKIAKGFLKKQGDGTASQIATTAKEFIQILKARRDEYKNAMMKVNDRKKALVILEKSHDAAIGNAPVHEPKRKAYPQPQPEPEPEPEPKRKAYPQPQPEPEPEPEPERFVKTERERSEELSRMTRVAEEKLPLTPAIQQFMDVTGMNITYATRSLNAAGGDLTLAINRQYAEEKLPLTPAIQQFMDVTGMNITYATRSLNAAGGDLTLAINRQYAALSNKRKKSKKRKKHSKKKKTKKSKKKVKKKYKSKRR